MSQESCLILFSQAPRLVKSLVMAFYLLSMAAGNLFTSAVNFLMIGADGVSRLQGAAYFWLFAGMMLATAGLFARVAKGLDDPSITRLPINRPS